MTVIWYEVDKDEYLFLAHKKGPISCEECELPLLFGQEVSRVHRYRQDKDEKVPTRESLFFHRRCASELVLQGATR